MNDTILRIDDGRRQQTGDYMSTGANALSDDAFSKYTTQNYADAAKIVILSPGSTQAQREKAFKILQGADPKQAGDLLSFLRSEILVHKTTPPNLKDRLPLRDDPSSNSPTVLQTAQSALNSAGGNELAKIGSAALTGATLGTALGPIGTAVGAVLGAGVGFLENLFSGGGGSPQGSDPQRPGRSNGDARTFIEQLNNIYPPNSAYSKIIPNLPVQINVDDNLLSLINIDPGNLLTWHNNGLIDQALFDQGNGGWFVSWDRSNFWMEPGVNGNTPWCWFSIPNWLTKGLYNSDQVTFLPNSGGVLCVLNVGRGTSGQGVFLPYWYVVTTFSDGTIRYDAVAPATMDSATLISQIETANGYFPATNTEPQTPNASASTAAQGTVGKTTSMFVPLGQSATQTGSSSTAANIAKNAAASAGAGTVALHGCGASSGGMEFFIAMLCAIVLWNVLCLVAFFIFKNLHFKKIILSLRKIATEKWHAVKKVIVI